MSADGEFRRRMEADRAAYDAAENRLIPVSFDREGFPLGFRGCRNCGDNEHQTDDCTEPDIAASFMRSIGDAS